MNQTRALLISLAFSLTACGGTVTEQTDPDPDPDPPNKDDHDAVAACGTAVCPDGWAQKIEGGSPFAMYDMPCVVEGLRDRKTGVYKVELDHTFTNGSETTTFTLFVTPSGEVELAAYRRDDIDGDVVEEWAPTQRCTLADVGYFDACLTAVQAGDGMDTTDEAWNCVYPGGPSETEQVLPWFAGCEAKAPTCE